jgi:hypothetical protein
MTYYGRSEFIGGRVEEYFQRVIAGNLITITLTRNNASDILLSSATINIEKYKGQPSLANLDYARAVSVDEFETALRRALNFVARTAGVLNYGFVSREEHEEELRKLYRDSI